MIHLNNKSFGRLVRVKENSEYYRVGFSTPDDLIMFEKVLDEFEHKGILEYTSIQFPISPEVLIERYFLENPIEKREVLSSKQPYELLLKRLDEYILNVSSVTGIFYITDDYFFCSPKGVSDIDYLNILINLLRKIKHSKIIVIVSDYKKINNGLFEGIKGQLCLENIVFSYLVNSEFHDRFWISDNKGGFVLGTSINGLAKRTSLIQKLDFVDYIEILKEISLLSFK